MLDAITSSATHTLATIDAVVVFRQQMRETLSTEGLTPREDLLDVLTEQPYCRIVTVEQRCGVSRPTAKKWLDALTAVGMLREEKVGRTLIYSNPALMEALTA